MLEDLHWIDSESQSLLDRVIESLPTARILCLVSSRPEFEHDWTNKSYYTQISLEPLAPGLAQTLLDTLLGGDPALDALKRQLIERTEGNPFFLEESVWHLAETGALTGARGAYRPARPIRDAQVPATVHAVLAARIDRLPALEKRLLQAAAVIGKDVPLPLLAAISDLGEERLRLALRQLQAAELLYEVPLFPAPEYTFKHALTYEVAAASVLRERRRALDARIVETLEALGAEPRADQVERLAHHALRGEVWDKALTYCRQAGARAFARSAHRAAVEWFEHALAALAHLPETPHTVGAAIDLRLELRSSLSPLAEFTRMQDHLQEAERLAEAAGDRRRQGLVAAFLTNFYTVMLELRRAIEYGERAVAIAAQVGDVEAQVLAHTFLGLARYGQGDYRAAVELARHNVTLLRGDLVRERFGMAVLPAVYSRTVLVWSLAELGEFADGLAVGQENAPDRGGGRASLQHRLQPVRPGRAAPAPGRSAARGGRARERPRAVPQRGHPRPAPERGHAALRGLRPVRADRRRAEAGGRGGGHGGGHGRSPRALAPDGRARRDPPGRRTGRGRAAPGPAGGRADPLRQEPRVGSLGDAPPGRGRGEPAGPARRGGAGHAIATPSPGRSSWRCARSRRGVTSGSGRSRGGSGTTVRHRPRSRPPGTCSARSAWSTGRPARNRGWPRTPREAEPAVLRCRRPAC